MRAHLCLPSFLSGLLFLALPLSGCGSPDTAPDSGHPVADGPIPDGGSGNPVSCDTDDDCEDEPELRACRSHACSEPYCPAGMTYVAAGTFTQGCDSSDKDCKADAQPKHDTTIGHAFCISRTELSVAQFRECVTAGQCQAPADLVCTQRTATWTQKAADKEHTALNCLFWEDARAACAHAGGRLPTEAEWEKAARGRDGRRYPWKGNTVPIDCQRGVNWGGGGCIGQPWPVGSGKGLFANSASYALDMAGNLWEWTADWYDNAAYAGCGATCTDPIGPKAGKVRVRRGGSFSSVMTQELRASNRDYQYPAVIRSDSIGVRCAAAPLK